MKLVVVESSLGHGAIMPSGDTIRFLLRNPDDFPNESTQMAQPTAEKSSRLPAFFVETPVSSRYLPAKLPLTALTCRGYHGRPR